MSDETGDQTEAELERTRQVVREATLAQVEANTAAATAGVTPSDEAAVEGETAVEQPKGNASRDEWAAYAAAQGHDIDDGWTRDEIRDLFAEED